MSYEPIDTADTSDNLDNFEASSFGLPIQKDAIELTELADIAIPYIDTPTTTSEVQQRN
jgi:hypothetical protein